MRRIFFHFIFLALSAWATVFVFPGSAHAGVDWGFLNDVTLSADMVGVPLNPLFNKSDDSIIASNATIPSNTAQVAVTVAFANTGETVTVNGADISLQGTSPVSTTLTLPLPGNKIEITATGTSKTETFTINVVFAAPPVLPDDPSVPVTGFVVSPDVMSLDLKGKSVDKVVGIITPSDATNQSISWSVTPEGIVRLGATTSTSRTPITVTALKEGTATITGRTANNLTDTCMVTVESITPLSVDVSPGRATVVSGDSVTFTATANGGTTPYSYQWAKGESGIAGATGSTFTIGSALEKDAGTYTCTVTDSPGSTASASGTLEVAAPGGNLTLAASSIASNGCTLVATLTNKLGDPIPRRSVTIAFTTGPSLSATGITDQDGKLTWYTGAGANSLNSSTSYTVVATSPGCEKATLTFTTDSEDSWGCSNGIGSTGGSAMLFAAAAGVLLRTRERRPAKKKSAGGRKSGAEPVRERPRYKATC